jgi:hypothetical protein
MPTFDFTSPDGKQYSVQGPDGATQEQAFSILQQQIGGAQQQPQRGVMDQLTGATGERYQTWPERLVRGIGNSITSGATLPADVYSGRAQLPSSGAVPGSVPFGDPASSGERVADLAGFAAPMNPAARAGDKAIPGIAKALNKPEVPTSEALFQSAGKGFDAARDAGVAIPGSGMQRMGAYLEQQLRDKGIYPEHAPDTYAAIARLRDTPADAPLSMGDIHNIRQSFGNAAGNFSKPKDTLAGSMGVQLVDRFLQAASQKGDVVGTAAADASGTLSNAIGDYGAAMRSDTVTGKADLAALRAKVSNSGQNLDNATRQRFVDIASEGKASRGFSDPEIAQAAQVAEGAPWTNRARFVGNALGGGRRSWNGCNGRAWRSRWRSSRRADRQPHCWRGRRRDCWPRHRRNGEGHRERIDPPRSRETR